MPSNKNLPPEFPASATPPASITIDGKSLPDFFSGLERPGWDADYPPEPSPLVEETIRHTSLADVTGAIVLAAQKIEDAINNPELLDDVRDFDITAALAELDASKQPLEERLSAIHFMRRSAQGEIAAIKMEESRLSARRRTLEAQESYWNNYVLQCLKAAGQKFKTALFSVSVVVKKAARVVVFDESLIPSPKAAPGLWKFTAPQISKTAIQAAIKDGREIPGARTEDSEFLQWR